MCSNFIYHWFLFSSKTENWNEELHNVLAQRNKFRYALRQSNDNWQHNDSIDCGKMAYKLLIQQLYQQPQHQQQPPRNDGKQMMVHMILITTKYQKSLIKARNSKAANESCAICGSEVLAHRCWLQKRWHKHHVAHTKMTKLANRHASCWCLWMDFE